MRKLVKQISIILAVILMVTSMPVNSYAATIDESVPVETVENGEKAEVSEENENLEDADENSADTEDVSDDENEAAKEAIDKEEDIVNDYEDESVEVIEEDGVVSDESVDEEALAEAATEEVRIKAEDTDKSGTGWSWNASTHKLTLTNANLMALYIYCSADIVVKGDCRIENSTKSAFRIEDTAETVSFTGNGTLTLASHSSAYAFLVSQNSGVPVVTVDGDSLVIDCQSDYSNSSAVYAGGKISITNGATLKATASLATAISLAGELSVINEGKIITSSPDNYPAVWMNPNSTLNISGEESVFTSNKTSYSGTANPVIYYSSSATSVRIKEGGKLIANNIAGGDPRVIKTADLDICGGIIEAHSRANGGFTAGTSMLQGTDSLLYEPGGLDNSTYLDSTKKYIKITETATDWIYVNADPALRFTDAPDSEICIKNQETATLAVEANLVNTLETPVINYQWYQDGQAIEGATNKTYVTEELSEETHIYTCKAEAHLTSGDVSSQTGEIKVTANKWGVLYGSVKLNITNDSASDSNVEQGWAWDKETATLTLDNAFLKSIEFTRDATIKVLSDSYVSSNDSHAFYIHGTSNITITGNGTLNLKTDGDRIASLKSTVNATVTIKGEQLDVECVANTSNMSAVDVSGDLVVTDKATLNISSKQSEALSCGQAFVISDGGKVNAYTDCVKDVIAIEDRAEVKITGRGTVLTTDRALGTNWYSIRTEGGSSKFTLDDHAKIVLSNCSTGRAPMDLGYAKVTLGNGKIFASTSEGSFSANSKMVTSKYNELEYLEAGLYNTKIHENGYLQCINATSSWRYIGDQPYLEFTTNPAEKSAVKAGENIALTVAAELKESEDTPNISYQWYLDGQAVLGATSATSAISTEGLAIGPHKVYCKAKMTTSEIGDIEKDSTEFTVYITEDGSMPRIEKMDLRSADTSDNETEGWSWDKTTKTLTLDNYMQYLDGDAIVLPAKSTIILKGKNLIQTKNGIPIQCNGDLLVYGTGNINLNREVPGTNFAIYSEGKLTIGGELSKGTREDRTNYQALKQVLYEGTGLYEARIEGNDTPFIYFDETPSDRVFTSTLRGTAPSIEISARLVNTDVQTACKYQWYVTSDWEHPESEAEAISGATALEYKAPVTERGGKYYYCKVTTTNNGNTYTELSDVFCVVVGDKNVKPITKTQTIADVNTDQSEYGWKYEKSEDGKGTLTLNNVEGFIPFAGTGNYSAVFNIEGTGDIEVVTAKNTVNNFSGCCGAFYFNRSSCDTFTISGEGPKGTIEYHDGVDGDGLFRFTSWGFKSLVVSNNVNVIENNGYSNFKTNTNITVDKASLSLCSTGSQLGAIKVINGGNLATTSNKTINCKEITIDKNSEMFVKYTNQNNAAVTITDALGEINVGGTLSINCLNANALYIKSDSAKESLGRIELTDNAVILSPAVKTVEELYIGHRVEYDVYGKDELLIAQSSFSRTAIVSATDITGKMEAGSTVLAGNISPANATVIYQWQYAESDKSADALWKDINNANGKTFTINDDQLIGKYLRVKITGITNYYGTVYSKSTTPVTAVGATMVDFMADGVSIGRYSGASTLRLSYENGLPEEVAIRVLAEDPTAQIVIKNITEGFDEKTDEEKTINGDSGMMPVHYSVSDDWNYNTIKVTITSGDITRDYTVKLETWVNETKITIKASSTIGVMITDEEHDMDHPLKVVEHGARDSLDTVAGKEYTVIAFSEIDGRYVTSFGLDSSSAYYDKYAKNDEDAGYRYVTLKMPLGKNLMFDLSGAGERVFAPEFLAQWGFDSDDGYYISTQWDIHAGYAKYDADKYSGNYFVSLFDDEGNEINLGSESGFTDYDDLNGIAAVYKVNAFGYKESLDPSKSYTLKVWKDVDEMSVIDVQEITIDAISVDMSDHHIVIEKPADSVYETSALVNSKAKAYSVEQFPGKDVSGVEILPDGNYLKIIVQTTAQIGTVYAMVYQRTPDGRVVSDIVKIDIVQPETDVYVGLSETKGTLDIYKNCGLEIPVNTTNTAATITAVSFVESSNTQLSDKFTITRSGKRTVVVTPADLPATTADNVDWANVVKGYKGTFKAKLQIELTDSNSIKKTYTTTEFYTMTIGGKAPAVTAKALKFNSFFENDNQTISLATKNGNIISAVIDTAKTKGTVVACPSWLKLNDGGLDATLLNAGLINNKGNGKLYLNVTVDGYRVPAQVAIPVSAVYSAPKVKLSQTVVTVPANAEKFTGEKQLSLMYSDKKADYTSLKITSIRVADTFDLNALSEKEQTLYSSSKYFVTGSYSAKTGAFAIKKTSKIKVSEIKAGKILLIATVGGNSYQEIKLPLTIRVMDVTKATIKTDRSSITINSNLDDAVHNEFGAQTENVTVVPSIAGISLEGITWTVTDAAGRGDYKNNLNITETAAKGTFAIKTNSLTTDGTYKVNFSLPGVAKPATMTVVVKASVPSIRMSKSSVSLDRYLAVKDGSKKQATVGIVMSDKSIKKSYSDFSFVVTDAKKNVVTDALKVTFDASAENMNIMLDNGVENGAYTVEIAYTMPSGKQAKAKTIVRVTAAAPVLKPDKKSVKVNADLGIMDCAKVKIVSPEKYLYEYPDAVTVYDSKNNVADSAIKAVFNSTTGSLSIYADSTAVKGANYKVRVSRKVIACGENGTIYTDISVNVPKADRTGKTAIRQTVKTKGSLVIARPNVAMQVAATYVGWNGDVYPSLYPDAPEVEWAVYAFDKSGKPYHCSISGYQYSTEEGLKGLVAYGDKNYSGSSLDWFVDSDSSDYGVALRLNYNNPAIKKLAEADGFAGITYKLTYKTKFGTGQSTVSELKFKVNNGSVKLGTVPTTITLDKNNRLDSKVIKVELKDKDAISLNIAGVSLPANSNYDASLLYVGGGYAYVAIGWKNDTVPANVKSGRETLSLYSGFNFEGRLKANGTTVVTVTVK